MHVPKLVFDAFYPVAGLALGALLGFIVRVAILPHLARLATRTATTVDDALFDSVRRPIVFWGAFLGLYMGISLASYEPRVVEAIHKPLLALVIMSVSWSASSVAAAAVQLPRAGGRSLPAVRILSTAARVAVLVVGALVALETLGVSVAPMLTALGVGGLAVGLALQDTLANLFAGFHILASRQIRPGDFIQLSSGEQGVVEDITWRNTTLRQPSNNIVIVPNSKLSTQIAVNYSLPAPELSVAVTVSVDYGEDLPTVERVTGEVARSVQMDAPGAVRTHVPPVRFDTFGESGIRLSVYLRAEAYTANDLIRHEFMKRLHARYREEGITIPPPRREVWLRSAADGHAKP
ncbi:MAG: mechanosensitive ion channel family protein [Gemmatimonadaceae bacterium]|nr:mechanosensitive ion channel family protein [Gemmatimonadaceae bacterium]